MPDIGGPAHADTGQSRPAMIAPMSTAHGAHDYVDDPRNDTILISVNGALVPRHEAVVSVFDAARATHKTYLNPPNTVIMISRWWRQIHSVIHRRKCCSSSDLRLASTRAVSGMANQIALYTTTWKIRPAGLRSAIRCR